MRTEMKVVPVPMASRLFRQASYLLVEPEIRQVVVLHHVLLRLQPHFVGAPGLRFAARLDEFRRPGRFVREPFTAFELPGF
jgi:hypothetical protein